MPPESTAYNLETNFYVSKFVFCHVAYARKFTIFRGSRDVVGRSAGWVAGFGWRDLKGDLGEEKYFCLA